jgi:hypothetical protein
MKCQNCCKQMTCNRKECKQIKWSETKNYGEVTYVRTNDIKKRK